MFDRVLRGGSFRITLLFAATSVLTAIPAQADLIHVPGDCDTGGSPACTCTGNTCSPTPAITSITIRQVAITSDNITFDCANNPAYALGGSGSGNLAPDPIVDITGNNATLTNCIVQWGSGQGVYAHPAHNVTLVGNTVSGTLFQAIRVESAGSTTGGPAAIIRENVLFKARNGSQGPSDSSVLLKNLTDSAEVTCNVISSESNGVVSDSDFPLVSQCNAFYMYGKTYGVSGQSPIAELADQGNGMSSDRDCVVTVGDGQNSPELPTRCLKDPVIPQPGQVSWSASCGVALSNTCTDFLEGKPAFNLPVGPFDHDEDGDGVVDWHDGDHDGLPDSDVYGIGSTGRLADASNTSVGNALLVGVQRGLWFASQSGHTNHGVTLLQNYVISMASANLQGLGMFIASADGLTIQSNTVIANNWGILTDKGAQTGFPIVISGNVVKGAASSPVSLPPPESQFAAIQLQRTLFGTKAVNRVEGNSVSAWKGIGVGVYGGSASSGLTIAGNHFVNVGGAVFDLEEFNPGTSPIDLEVMNNDSVAAPASATASTDGFLLSFSPGTGASLSVHDNDIVAQTMFHRVNDTFSSFRVFHNVFRPGGATARQTEGGFGLHLVTDTTVNEGNNWMTHCDASVSPVWTDTPASILSPATIDPNAYEGNAPLPRPWDSGFPTSCLHLPITFVSLPTDPDPAGSNSGAATAGCGDLLGNGLDAQCVGSTVYPPQSAVTTSVEPGAVLVYFGSTSAAERAQPDLIFTGVGAHDRAGVSVAGNFDFNGDGRPDIVIGAEQVDRITDPAHPTPTGNGKVYVIFFDPTDTAHYPHINDPNVPDVVSLSLIGQAGGIPGVVFEGEAFGDRAGFSVAAGGTSTPSAGQDILIGAPGADPGGRTDAGAAYVVFDNSDPLLSGTIPLSRVSDGLPDQFPGKAYFGAAAGDNLGFSTAFAGPVVSGQNVTRGSVVMGAPGASGRRGTSIVPPGDPDTTPIIVDAVGTTHTGFQIGGTQVGEQVGYAVADGRDALADGVPDILIGAPTYDAGGLTDAGRVLQTTQIIPSGVYAADAVGTTIGGVIWTGEGTGDQLGYAVAGVSDVTGDGIDDVVLGAPFVDTVAFGVTQVDAGAVYLINGRAATGALGVHSVAEVGTTVAGEELTGTQAGEHVGSSIAGTGDMNGDGANDFVVGAPARNAGEGTVYIVLHTEPASVGQCASSGCIVSDFVSGAELAVPAGGLATAVSLTVDGILDAAQLPAPVPAGKMLLGAARFAPEGQTVSPPGATIRIPTVQAAGAFFAPSEVLPLFYYNGSGWVLPGISGTTEPSASHPTRLEVVATVGVLHVYAAFVNDADGDEVRDELDNCPVTPNPSQLDTNHDGVGDACQCLSVNCADGNPCTDDSCTAAAGCIHTNNSAACDDGIGCTANDTCAGGACSGTPVAPAELQNARFNDKTMLFWDTIPNGPHYDVLRGSLAALPVGPGGADESCFDELTSASLVDSATPAQGAGFWYVMRGENSCGGIGTFGTQHDGTPRVTTTCP